MVSKQAYFVFQPKHLPQTNIVMEGMMCPIKTFSILIRTTEKLFKKLSQSREKTV